MIEAKSIVWMAGSVGWVHDTCADAARVRFRAYFDTPGNGDRFLAWVDGASAFDLDRLITTYDDDLFQIGGMALKEYVERAWWDKRERTTA